MTRINDRVASLADALFSAQLGRMIAFAFIAALAQDPTARERVDHVNAVAGAVLSDYQGAASAEQRSEASILVGARLLEARVPACDVLLAVEADLHALDRQLAVSRLLLLGVAPSIEGDLRPVIESRARTIGEADAALAVTVGKLMAASAVLCDQP